MSLTRRKLLRLAGGAAVALPVASVLSGCQDEGSTGALRKSDAKVPTLFKVPLPVPPVLKPSRSEGGVDYYDIVQKPAQVEILPGLKTEIWGYNGLFPGPTLATRSERKIVVRHTNQLEVPVAVHLHGAKTPAEHDGFPTDLILPDGGWSGHTMHGGNTSQGSRAYEYPLAQPAATLWYHDHRMDFTGPQVYKGLAGFHLVHDEEEDNLPLPKGDRDIPLMICDRSFTESGAFAYPSIDPSLTGEHGVTQEYMKGVLGDVILVNGAPWPVLEVDAARYRFRLLNASNARRYQLSLDPGPQSGPAFVQVGSDSGLLGRPIGHDEIRMSEAERFDVVVDFSQFPVGTKVSMLNTLGDGDAGKVMQFHVVRRAADDSTVPSRLVDFEPLSRSAATVTRKFHFNQRSDEGWDINGAMYDPEEDQADPELGATEIWRFDGDADHPIHLHLAHFQVLSRNGNEPGRWDAGWKDTVDMQSGKEIEVIARFTGYKGRYVFHCHNLEHEDMGMMANFSVR
ncbi:multicopper oxidase family protein [Streptomyces sp. ADMS]|uniref:multicopper oxidase family protein n=1 Tax=Streptomyces sp. ADMS TaxID=3071415 RepID=UPI00296FEEA9|nr:multicopper oxidase family protein [Streptomyces sp. ADMS]MDW4905898.1 multicopper oxidase family protein [Streptomyces sp. ADMS]